MRITKINVQLANAMTPKGGQGEGKRKGKWSDGYNAKYLLDIEIKTGITCNVHHKVDVE